jgi:hypothetical protein
MSGLNRSPSIRKDWDRVPDSGLDLSVGRRPIPVGFQGLRGREVYQGPPSSQDGGNGNKPEEMRGVLSRAAGGSRDSELNSSSDALRRSSPQDGGDNSKPNETDHLHMDSIWWYWSYAAPEATQVRKCHTRVLALLLTKCLQLAGLRLVLRLASLVTFLQATAIMYLSHDLVLPIVLNMHSGPVFAVSTKWLVSVFFYTDGVMNWVWQGPGWKRYQVSMKLNQVRTELTHGAS